MLRDDRSREADGRARRRISAGVLFDQSSEQVDVSLHRQLTIGAFAFRPGVILCAALDVEHTGPAALHVPRSRLLAEREQ